MHRPNQDPAPNPMSDGDFLTRTAHDWVARRDRGLTHAEARALAAWQAADARHAAAYERASAAWRGLDGIGNVPELAAMADDVVARARIRRARRRWSRLGGLSVAAAAVVALGWIGWGELRSHRDALAARLPNENYRVIESTARRELLPDGTTVELNGASRIELAYTPTERRVRLLEGEAHFLVAKNPERPFFVTAGAVSVRAVGTAFNVRMASKTIEVLVTEGKVKLVHDVPPASTSATPETPSDADAPLIQGQRAVIERNPTAPAAVQVGSVDKVTIEQELGWQSTRLVFNNTALDEVVEGFNRYNSHRLTLGDPRLRERALTGVFRADNLEGFVRLLRASVDVKAEQRTPHETVLLPIR